LHAVRARASEMQVEAEATATPAPIIGPAHSTVVIPTATIISAVAPIVAATPITSPSPASPRARGRRGRREGQARKPGDPKCARRHGPNRRRRVHGQHGGHGGAADKTSFEGTAKAQCRLDHVWQSAFAPHHATLLHTPPPRALWRHGRTLARDRALLVGWPEVATIWALRGHIKTVNPAKLCRLLFCRKLMLERRGPGWVPRANTVTAGRCHLHQTKSSIPSEVILVLPPQDEGRMNASHACNSHGDAAASDVNEHLRAWHQRLRS
jgi:hypothetical protein